MQARLEALGVHTVGDLSRFAVLELEHHFGRYGVRLHELSRGIDVRQVQPDAPLQQISAEPTFAIDQPLHALDETLARLDAKVWDQGEKQGAIGLPVVLQLTTEDRERGG